MPTDNGATDIRGAAARLSSLMTSEQNSLPTEEREPEAQEAQAEDQEVMTDEIESTEETLEENQSDTETAEEEFYKVKVSGEEREVSLDDLKKGYMMDADYRQKTMNLSKEKEALESKGAEIDKQLEDARLLVEEEVKSLDSPDMRELKEYDPAEYNKIRDRVEAKVKKFEALQLKRSEEQQARQNKLIAKERDALFSFFPEWQDNTVMTKESGELMGVMKGLGYSDQELNNMTDHRMFVLAKKVQQLEAIQAQNLEAKKVKLKPKNLKAGNGTTKEDREALEVRDMRKRLKRSGSIQDAVNLLRI